MQHADHVALIEAGIPADAGGVWADLGAGSGAFTLALRDLAGPGVEIYAVDRDARALRSLRNEMERRFPGTRLRLIEADFRQPLDLPPLDGILAANAIHFVRDRITLLRAWRGSLKPAGRLLLVEYDADRGNQWVPYPVAFASLDALTSAVGFPGPPVLLGRYPSRFLEGMYAAMLLNL